MNNNAINQMLQFMTGGGSQEQFMQMFVSQNPNFNQAYNYMLNQANSNNMSMEQVAMSIAKKKGIDPNYLSQMAKKMGR